MTEASTALEKINSLDDISFKNYVNEKKREIVAHHIKNNTSYREFFGNVDFTHWEEVPIMTKKEFQKPLEQRLSNGFTPKNLRTYLREVEDRVQQNNPPTMPVTTLATLHAAKGLEWERVFLMGVSDGILPLENNSTTGDQASIDEERRLFYVGITRAKSDLRLSYRGKASRFLAEAGLAN